MVATPDALTATFSALSHPLRRALLEQLAEGKATVQELCAPHAVSQPAVSRHLKVLEQAGLVQRDQQGTYRPSRLEAEPLKEAAEWLVSFRRFWSESYDRLDELLAELQEDR